MKEVRDIEDAEIKLQKERPGQSTCMEQLLGTSELLGKKGTTPVSALASKEVVGLYFSARWCVLPVPHAPRESERATESERVRVRVCVRE